MYLGHHSDIITKHIPRMLSYNCSEKKKIENDLESPILNLNLFS